MFHFALAYDTRRYNTIQPLAIELRISPRAVFASCGARETNLCERAGGLGDLCVSAVQFDLCSGLSRVNFPVCMN
jgi:hypothetical protein